MMNRMAPPPTQMTPQMQMMHMNQMHAQNMMRNIKMEKYKTVPCKYFHGPQGCEKKTDCTFIHDDNYAGRSTPQMEMRFRPPFPNPPPGPQYMQQQPQQQQNYQNYGMMNTVNYARGPSPGYIPTFNNGGYPPGMPIPPPPSSSHA
jgi:hypothetical protein